jgi:hypothetical protein
MMGNRSDTPIKKNDKLILKSKEIGYVRGWAMEDEPGLGGPAYFKVGVNSVALPGICEMVININFWDVYHEDDPKILKEIMNAYIKPAISR